MGRASVVAANMITRLGDKSAYPGAGQTLMTEVIEPAAWSPALDRNTRPGRGTLRRFTKVAAVGLGFG
jgi:hypothetical protein